jgi:CBS domain-containing protein
MKVRDIMTPNPIALTPGDPIAAAAAMMRDRDVGFVPVVGDQITRHLAGVLTDRDIAVRCVAPGHAGRCTVGDHMTSRNVRTVRADADVHDVVAEMERRQVRRIPVVDDDGRLTGVVTQGDLALRLGPVAPLQVEAVLERISEPSLPIYF